MEKCLIVEFTGGFMDGKILRDDSEDSQEVNEAQGYYGFTDNGKLGKRFRAVSEAGKNEIVRLNRVTDNDPPEARETTFRMNHVYEVVDRQEDDEQITVRFEYKGKLEDT